MQEFQGNEDKTSGDFIDVGIITDFCNKENLPHNANEEIECENFEEKNEEFRGENEADISERRKNENEHENRDAKIAPAMKPGRGRPKIIKTGKPGRPAKRKHEVPVAKTQINDSESEEDAIIAEIEDCEKNEEFAGLTCVDPINAEQALKSPESGEWKNAMREEIDALLENKMWTVVERPKDKRVTGSKWVLQTKFNPDGSIEQRKAHLVAKGFSQRKDVDYFETFVPVARLESVRMVMALAVEKNLNVHQLDFVNAYLNGEIEEEIYLEIPSLFSEIIEDKKVSKSYENKVFRLNKALYGLKQSERCWFTKLDKKLKEMSFKQSSADHCVLSTK